MYHKIRLAILRKKIKKNPYIGQQADDGTYLYKEDGYSISYRIIQLSGARVRIEWVHHKRRLGANEEKIRRIKHRFFDFWYYQQWLFFFRPSILILIIVGMFLFYSEMVETQETKMTRLKWMIASVIGINPKDIQYIGDDRLEISAQRKIPKEGISEPIRYAFSPLSWLFFPEAVDSVSRWRGRPFGYVTYPKVVYNKKGDVWLNKEGIWRHGRIGDETIKWDMPQGSRGVLSQEISVEDKKLEIIDRKYEK